MKIHTTYVYTLTWSIKGLSVNNIPANILSVKKDLLSLKIHDCIRK